jgi:hypothetical protein
MKRDLLDRVADDGYSCLFRILVSTGDSAIKILSPAIVD